MAKDTLTEDDEIVIIETEDENIPTGEPDPEEAAEPEEEDDEEDEERLAVSEDDSEDEITSKTKETREKRQKRRELQKRAKERSQRELEFLRQQNAELARRMQALEGNTLSQQVSSLDQQIQQTLYEAQQAEIIMARAIEASNGDDAAAALRIRDEARARANELTTYKQNAERVAQQALQPQVDPRVTSYAQQWLQANPWYNPQGRDENSAITKAIDNSLAAEGWNPADEGYWQELTRRVSARIGEEAPAPRAPKRKAPPTGNTREHAPTSSRNEVYVTPARKQAMIDAGIWDDPVRRDAQVRAYREYDKNNSAR
jgi:hypothetical protein